MSDGLLRGLMGLGFIGNLKGAGTAASLATVVLAWFLPQQSLLPVAIACTLLGLACCAPVVGRFGQKDPGWFVWDELCGMMISVLAAPKSFLYYAAAFALFRLFDIWKPGPIRWLETSTGATSIMNDDLAAGVLTASILFAFLKFV